MATGTLLINIDGQGNASNLSYTKTLDTLSLGQGKHESTIYFKADSSPASVSFTKAGTLSTLLVQSSSTTETITMTLNIDDGVLAPYTIVIPFMGIFVHNFGSTFFGYITSISFSTVATSFVELNVRAYS